MSTPLQPAGFAKIAVQMLSALKPRLEGLLDAR